MNFTIIPFLLAFIFCSVSLVGFGLFFGKVFSKHMIKFDLGFFGLTGLLLSIIYSYISNYFVAHSKLHNLIFLTIGFIFFLYFIFYKNKFKFFHSKDLILFFFIVLIIFLSLLGFKTHDDFPYYHFSYTYLLTQNNLLVGIGNFNHGFKTPSSLFYLNSLFYLPYFEYYLFQFGSAIIMVFVNYSLIQNLNLDFNVFKKDNKVYYLSFLSLIFINVFFYRLSEHGTDKSAQILIFLYYIQLLIVFKDYEKFSSSFSKIFLLLSIIISLKSFYSLYFILLLPIIIFLINKKKFFILIMQAKNPFFFSLILITILIFLSNLFSSGCLLFPLSYTCFENLSWAYPVELVKDLHQWYQQWAKAGASPNFRISDPEIYIQNFNWVSNWLKLYFFFKVSDFLLGIVFVCIFLIIYFKVSLSQINTFKINKYEKFLYILLLILFFEWFYNHPTLRYGGYPIICLLIFHPFTYLLKKINLDNKEIKKKVFTTLTIVVLIFISRNINRIYDENEKYSYNPFSDNVSYKIKDQDFRLNLTFDKLINHHRKNCIINKDIDCKIGDWKINKTHNYYIFSKND